MIHFDMLQEFFRHPPWLEIVANTFNLVSIALATRNSIHTWWSGILGCALFGWLFATSRLYADVTLQVFFIVTSAAGWWHWLHHRGHRDERPVTRTSTAELAIIIPLGALAATSYGWLLHRFTNAYAPFIDSSVLAISVAAQFLLMRRKVETWIFWFVANSISIPLFISRNLWLTAFFYLLFWMNAPLGFIRWRRELRIPVSPDSLADAAAETPGKASRPDSSWGSSRPCTWATNKSSAPPSKLATRWFC